MKINILLIPGLFSFIVQSLNCAEMRHTYKPIIFGCTRDQHIIKEYAWGGTGIAKFYGWQTKKIAEVWFNSTQKDGLTKLPDSNEALEELIRQNPAAMLGSELKFKPIFCKILGKDEHQPQILHTGFNESIRNNKEHFIKLCQQERTLIVAIKNSLQQLIQTQEQFNAYKQAYDDWTCQQIATQWSNATLMPALPTWLSTLNINLFHQLRIIRQQLVSFLNEIPLRDGQVLLSPVGNIHSIVGSHQMHPPAHHPNAKNEAYYIFSVDSSDTSNPMLLYFEPQQTSNTTYSPFDLATPIEFSNGSVVMRKNLTKGLDALLHDQEQAPSSEQDAIRLMLERAIRFEPTDIQDILINNRIQNITQSSRYAQAVNAHVESLIEGSYEIWPHHYFTLERITLEGQDSFITVNPVCHLYHELFVVQGTVLFDCYGQTTQLSQGAAVFIPASCDQPYNLTSLGKAQLLRVYPGPT